MKKTIILFIGIALVTTSDILAQSRKYISQFSHLQGYYNPALTGYEGSMIRGFVRNQWAGWEGAPKTYFASAELDFGQLSGQASGDILGKNAAGISLLHDQYGAFAETEFVASYASRIQIGEKTNLRLGAGLNYRSVRLDGNSMTTEQADDPIVGQYLGSFSNMQVMDFNLGIAVTHPNYYVSYAVHHVNQGAINSGDVFMERMPRVGIFQAGYRNRMTDNLALATNFMYRSQVDLPDNVEFNMKVVLKEKFWLGGGHRIDYANNFQFGLLFDKMRIGYIYEMPTLKSYLLPNVTHEFMLTYALFGDRRGMIW
ncbi:type IX secretion system membrane protein, PorP/SprF family [Belliella buryatensis]|uniref:Type IX secretion system membrane protein, PorP/SprF family n=1 Tax=Belliella buryatensis TaxID=1500549 RepID=A0A239HEX5_9BACT|nr:type IX secretion system membrane protein PorP/SprF [Belliella buryatensis]SNS79900.1 type IX secretion system membrane protein, PorP/SprF family [Belliella buryatensis]